MTIQELYNWAKENNCTEVDLYALGNDGCMTLVTETYIEKYNDIIECVEVL